MTDPSTNTLVCGKIAIFARCSIDDESDQGEVLPSPQAAFWAGRDLNPAFTFCAPDPHAPADYL